MYDLFIYFFYLFGGWYGLIDVVQLNRLNDWIDVLRERKDLMDVVPYADTTNVWFNQPSYKFPTNHWCFNRYEVAFRFAGGLGTSDIIKWLSSNHVPGSILECLNLKQQAATSPQKTCLTSSISLHGQCYPKYSQIMLGSYEITTHCIEP